MNFRRLLLVLVLALSVSGCGILLPKRVELFQDKVKAFPEQKASEREVERQTAFRAKEKAQETFIAAVETAAAPKVVAPAKETMVLTEAVSLSVGPPKYLAGTNTSSEELAKELRRSVAALNKRIDDFKADNNENTGKKIEGTGLFQFGYFSMWLVILGVVAVLWGALKIYGMVNPIVGLGVNTVGRVSSRRLKKGVSELAEGGEWFKEYLKEVKTETLSKEEILDLFRRAHSEAQSRDTQDIIEQLTLKRK